MREQQRHETKARSQNENAARQRSIEVKLAEKQSLVQKKLAEVDEMRKLRAEVRREEDCVFINI